MNHVLANENIHVEIDPVHGRIVQLSDRRRGIHLVGEPRLAENFRIRVPLPNWEGHYIRGSEQALAAVTRGPDRLELSWENLKSAHGVFPICFTLTLTLEPDGVLFRSSVANRSPYPVAEVFTPMLGGLANAAERNDWVFHRVSGAGRITGTGEERLFYREFNHAYLGTSDPLELLPYPTLLSMPWLDLYHRTRRHGVYFSPEDPEPRLGSWVLQLRPTVNWGGTHWEWPDPKHESEPIGLALGWVTFPFVATGADYTSAPVAVRFHDGIWYEAARLYRRWYDRHFKIDRIGDWLDAADAWQSTIIQFPDGTIGYRFRDLPNLARAALSAGINVIQVDGWNCGGLDRNYPQYEPDPRLGTPEELREAVAECQRLGVRVLLFTNLVQVHVNTDWYRKELHAYTVRDYHGGIMSPFGWDYCYIGGHVLPMRHLMTNANVAHPRFNAIVQDQLMNVVRAGAAGTQIDKLHCGMGADFNPDLTQAPDLNVTDPMIRCVAEHLAAAQRVDPAYRIAGEAYWDRLVPYVSATYSRHWYTDRPQTTLVTFPELRQTACITGHSDFRLVTNALRLGLIVNLEAKNLHGCAADAPAMIPFVKAALALRRRLRDVMWDSRIVDHHGLVIAGDARVLYTLHASRRTPGKYALILNHFAPESLRVEVALRNGGKVEARLHRIAATDPAGAPCALPGAVEVPPNECIVIDFTDQRFSAA